MRAIGLEPAVVQVLLIYSRRPGTFEPGVLGLHVPSMLQACPPLRVRLSTQYPAATTTTPMTASSQYRASPATIAEPPRKPANGNAQHATQAIPVIQAMRLELESGASFDIPRSFSSTGKGSLRLGVRSMVKRNVACASDA